MTWKQILQSHGSFVGNANQVLQVTSTYKTKKPWQRGQWNSRRFIFYQLTWLIGFQGREIQISKYSDPTNMSSKPGDQRDSIANVLHQRIKVLYTKAAYPQTGNCNWAWITVKWIADGMSVRSLTAMEAQFFCCHVWGCNTQSYAIFLRFNGGNRQSPQSKLPFNILQVQLLQLPTYFHLSWFFQPSTSGQHLQTSDIWMDLRDLSRKSRDANGKMCMSHYVHFFDAWISRSLLICSYICTIDACLEMTPISDFPLPIHPVPFWSCDSIIMLWRLIAFLWHVSLDVSGPCKRCQVDGKGCH